ncbi:hypothetical protein LINPERHAP1_LOCUS18604 [Linum perenne]
MLIPKLCLLSWLRTRNPHINMRVRSLLSDTSLTGTRKSLSHTCTGKATKLRITWSGSDMVFLSEFIHFRLRIVIFVIFSASTIWVSRNPE